MIRSVLPAPVPEYRTRGVRARPGGIYLNPSLGARLAAQPPLDA
jgi:hypothetical protein